VKSLAKSLQLNVNNANAHEVLGRCLMIIGRFDAAQIEFQQAARLNPKSAEVRQNLGKLFSIQDNWSAAKTYFEEAIRLDPVYLEAYDGLGLALEALGDNSGAIANYQKAITLNQERKGNFFAPCVNLSALYNKTGNIDAAVEYAQKALAINPKSDTGLFQMAKAQERRGELEAAVASLIAAISINPRSSSYHYVLGTVYRRLGKTDESREAFDLFRKLEKESSEIDQKKRDAAKGEPVRFSASPKGGAVE
jgi:tetratricopeptide (TPR) repeat protein